MRIVTIGGPLAAAAVIALAFLGVFDNKGPSQVAGVQELANPAVVQSASPLTNPRPAASPPAVDPAEQALGDFIDQTQNRMKDKGESVQRVLDLTVLQMLDILEEAKAKSELRGKNESPSLTPIAPKPTGESNQPDGESESPPTDDTDHPGE